MARPSIYEFAGGDPAFLGLAAAHHERCLQEPEISHAFSHGFNPAHIENLAYYWAEVFGGPARYSELLGGHSGMLEMHARTGAADDWGQRFVACFVQAADDAFPTIPSSVPRFALTWNGRPKRSCHTRPPSHGFRKSCPYRAGAGTGRSSLFRR
jgi:truncated hemoglobin YjbI